MSPFEVIPVVHQFAVRRSIADFARKSHIRPRPLCVREKSIKKRLPSAESGV
jgi:hypothetical protein